MLRNPLSEVFAPSFTPEALSTYAASSKYGVLLKIIKGDGFWVNAKNAVTVDLASVSSATGVTYSGILGGNTSIANKHLGSPAIVNGAANYVAGGVTVTTGSLIQWDSATANEDPLTTLLFNPTDNAIILVASGGFGISCRVSITGTFGNTDYADCSGIGVTFDRAAGKIAFKSAPIQYTTLTATGSLSFPPF